MDWGNVMLEEFERWRPRLFAWALANLNQKYERAVANYKRRLFQDLSGTVVEIGPGAGANLPYYSRGVRWIGIEPNPFMDRYLTRQAQKLGMEIEIRRGTGEQLPLPDASADAVVSTLVLCSVSNLASVLAEVLRVLRPGGRFVFLEHVAAPEGTWLRRLQGWLRPIWMRLGEGCQPDRETWIALQRAGFATLDYSGFKAPVPVVSPQIVGVGIK